MCQPRTCDSAHVLHWPHDHQPPPESTILKATVSPILYRPVHVVYVDPAWTTIADRINTANSITVARTNECFISFASLLIQCTPNRGVSVKSLRKTAPRFIELHSKNKCVLPLAVRENGTTQHIDDSDREANLCILGLEMLFILR